MLGSLPLNSASLSRYCARRPRQHKLSHVRRIFSSICRLAKNILVREIQIMRLDLLALLLLISTVPSEERLIAGEDCCL